MFQHLQGRPAPPPPAPAGAAVRSERGLLKTTQKSLKTTQNRSEPLKTAQNRSESLRIAQIRFKLSQNHEKSSEFGVILGNLQSLLFEEP